MFREYKFVLLITLVASSVLLGSRIAAATNVELSLENLDGGRHIDLGVLKSLNEDGTVHQGFFSKQIRLTTNNTSGNRYKITQFFHSNPISGKGKHFPIDSIFCHVILESGGGIVRMNSPTQIRNSEQDLFLSNESGDDVSLIVIYEVRVPVYQESGQYWTRLNYRTHTI